MKEHTRVDQFVRSKAGELDRRLSKYFSGLSIISLTFLAHLDKVLAQLSQRFPPSSDVKRSVRRNERYAKVEDAIHHVGQELENLDRFVKVNRQAFRKILKKHKKWTNSPDLEKRFRENVFSRPTSFANRDLASTYASYNEILAVARNASSEVSEQANGPSRKTSTSNSPASTPATSATDGPTDSCFSARNQSSETSAPDEPQPPLTSRRQSYVGNPCADGSKTLATQ